MGRNRKLWVIIIVALMAIAITFFIMQANTATNPVSREILKRANFAVYVPQNLPEGYKLSNDSVSLSDGVLFIELINGTKKISISQQSAPNNLPQIESLAGFKPMDVGIGKAMVGEQDGQAAALVLTNNSLITITGNQEVSKDILSGVVASLGPARN